MAENGRKSTGIYRLPPIVRAFSHSLGQSEKVRDQPQHDRCTSNNGTSYGQAGTAVPCQEPTFKRYTRTGRSVDQPTATRATFRSVTPHGPGQFQSVSCGRRRCVFTRDLAVGKTILIPLSSDLKRCFSHIGEIFCIRHFDWAVALSAPAGPPRCRRGQPPSGPHGRVQPGRHRRARTYPSPGRTGRFFCRDTR